MRVLKSIVDVDAFTDYASNSFDYKFTGESSFECHNKPQVPSDFSIGVIHGSSGSGKSTLLKEFGNELSVDWNSKKAIVSHFNSPQEAVKRLSAVGLNDIPSWMKPYHVLSNGEKFRADLARRIMDNAVIDEFTSVVNRSVAKSASVAVSRLIRDDNIKGVVFSTCHSDILEWIEPDWHYNTDTCELSVGRYLRRPIIRLEIHRCNVSEWKRFKNHHYLSGDINNAASCYGLYWGNDMIGFSAVLSMPCGTIQNAYREHRTVLLPDYQGIGIGVRFSDTIADINVSSGRRYFSKTTHPRMGEYRNKSDKWRATSKNMVTRKELTANRGTYNDFDRTFRSGVLAYSHEYVGRM